MKTMVRISAVLIGITAMASQVVFMRELLVVFYGNELSIGFMLAGWLICGAVGSALIGGSSDKIKKPVTVLSSCQIALGLILPATIALIRSSKNILGIPPGAIVSFPVISLSSLVILAPACIVLGFIFSLACRIYPAEPVKNGRGGMSQQQKGTPEDYSAGEPHGPDAVSAAGKIGNVYVLESAGSIVGGILAGVFLIRVLDSVRIMALLGILNVTVASLLAFFSEEGRSGRILKTAAGAMLVAMLLMWPFGGWRTLNESSVKAEWSGYDLLSSGNSIYGNVVAAKKAGQVSFFDNGLHLYSVPDAVTAEEAVHFALLEHPQPKSVLLIGGGMALAAEAVKYPASRIDYVELDPLIIETAMRELSEEYLKPFKDPRLSVILKDGRSFVKSTARKYDCVIMHLGDPSTAQVNRFYTVEFFRELNRILNKGAVVSFAVSSSENYINRQLRDLLRSLYVTLKEVFADVRMIPGDTAYFLASNGAGVLTYDYDVLMERSRALALDIKYVREYYLFSRLSPQKVAYAEGVLREARGEINRDLRPIAYYYDMVFWTSRFTGSLSARIFGAVTERSIWILIFCLCGIIILSGYTTADRNRALEIEVLTAVAAAGFSSMIFQMLIMLSFQAVYGYLFYKLSIILTSFMAGLALGGFVMTAVMGRLKKDMAVFIGIQAALCAYPVLLLFALVNFTRSAAPEAVFPALSAAAGALAGLQFPLAGKIYSAGGRTPGSSGGINYGADLLGASLGSLFAGAFLIPLVGIPKTCIAVMLINISVLVLLALCAREGRKEGVPL